MSQDIHEKVLANMREMAERFSAIGVDLELPPPSNFTLGTVYTEIEMGRRLVAQIKFDPRFTNPVRVFQGGFMCAAIDEVMGPLTYMAAGRPVLTLEMSTSFIRPFMAKDEYMEIAAEIVSQTQSVLILKAEVKSSQGKLLATATSHGLIMSEEKLKRQT